MNQGKALGGSSAINAQVFVPPTEANTDACEILRSKGWNWAMLQKCITKAYTSPAVDQELDNALDTAGWAGRNDLAKSPIRTSFLEAVFQEAWTTTLKAMSHSVATAPPTVDPEYLSHPADVEVFAQHTLQAERIAAAAGGTLLEQPFVTPAHCSTAS